MPAADGFPVPLGVTVPRLLFDLGRSTKQPGCYRCPLVPIQRHQDSFAPIDDGFLALLGTAVPLLPFGSGRSTAQTGYCSFVLAPVRTQRQRDSPVLIADGFPMPFGAAVLTLRFDLVCLTE